MSTNAIVLDGNAPVSVPARTRSPWRRALTLGLGAGLAILLAGDRGARTAVPTGIDPLEVLNLQVRANALVVLDSSGSMRERPDCIDANANGNCDSVQEGELAGDDQSAKMWLAKQVLKTVVTQNQTKVSFQFGRYTQVTTSYGPETGPTYIYSCKTAVPAGSTEQTCSSANAEFSFNFSGLSRTAGTHTRAAASPAPPETTYVLNSDNYRINRVYSVQSNGTTLCTTNGNVAVTGAAAWAPPTPATDWNLVGKDQPYIDIIRYTNTACTTGATTVRFYFRGVEWTKGNDINNACGGFDTQVALAACNNDNQISSIGPFLQPEVVPTVTDNDTTANLRAGAGGIRASGPTPIAESLIDFRTIFGTSTTTGMWGVGPSPAPASPLPAISGMNPKPSTFAIVVTDGDDTCTDNSTFSGSNLDNHALRAAYDAQLLFAGIANSGGAGVVDPASKVKTFVIVLGSGGSASRANWIAWGGTGMAFSGSGLTGSGNSTAWANTPSQSDRDNCTTCVDAFLASNATDLAAALQSAIDQGQSAGEFSDQQSITETVFEFAASVTLPSPSPGASAPPSPDPLNPNSRYKATIPILLQSTFELPTFKGHLNAFRSSGPAWDTTTPGSDAGQKLQDRVTASLSAPPYTFAQLRGGNSPVRTDLDIRQGGAGTIRRRIYTTPRNGVFINATYNSGTARSDSQRVTDLQDNDPSTGVGATTFRIPIWPPTTGTGSNLVDPDGTAGGPYPAGILDNALGIGANPLPPPNGGAAPAALTFAQLQSLFGACTASSPGSTGGSLPADCNTTTGTPSVQLQAARKEARQIILAFTAGAELVTANKLAVRLKPGTGCTTATVSANVGSLTTGCSSLRFQPRQWIMAESTLAAPGVVTPPLQDGPPASQHDGEYTLFRDGPRTDTGASVLLGMGLRNPDGNFTGTGADTARMRLKPVMSVVYHATNGMLHAFRAGPCRSATGTNGCQDSSTELGGEELWGFVPFDQLQNLKSRMGPQTRDPHTYMLASPVRFADVFVPGTWSRNVGGTTFSGDGVWRLMLVFGRGIAGKYYTALDVTAPGPFTEGSLSTKGPIPLWSRGNPDTNDLTTAGTANNDSTDGIWYAKMGQTWSVPAIANVTTTGNATNRTTGGVEFVAYTGSGFSTVAGEGSTLFTLDALTGDVVTSTTFDVGDRTSAPYDNAIVAGPAGFSAAQLTPPTVAKIAITRVTRVYFGDNNGRLWKVFTGSPAPSSPAPLADFGADQPVANSPSLLNYKGDGTAEKPFIFVETGNDNRITPPPASTPPFKMYGLRDDDLTTDPSSTDGVAGPVVVRFALDFPDGFRGNVQPATAFNTDSPPLGRVFFVGNKFNPITSTSTSCTSSFDAIFFAVGADTGSAAYDLNATGSDLSITKTGQRVSSVRVAAGGQLVLDTGLQADIAPPPPAPPQILAPAPALNAEVFFGPQQNATGLVAQSPVVYKLGSSVCR
jgi:hypothetical protein